MQFCIFLLSVQKLIRNLQKRKLSKLELQFDGKVREVEDHHRSFIDSLKQQKADVTRRLVRSCEELQVEKIAREKAEKYRQEAAIFTLEVRNFPVLIAK